MVDVISPMMVPLGGWTVPRPVFKRLEVVTPPSGLVIALAGLKSHLRITHSQDDDYLTELIGTATEMVENYVSRCLLTRSLRMWMDFIPGTGNEYTLYGAGTAQVPVRYANIGMFRWFELMKVPVLTVTAFKFIANDGTTVLFDPSQYIVDATDQDMQARIVLQRGAVWPVDLQVAHSLQVEYTAGYGASADVPAPLKHAVRLIAGALYTNRGDSQDESPNVLTLSGVKAILDPMRIRRL